MTEYLAVEGSTIGYGVAGSAPLTVDALASGHGRLTMIEGAGHLPHDQFPGQVVSLMLSFLQPHAARA
jgi:pimeloyl-ACP methyl ester carboxylesterase